MKTIDILIFAVMIATCCVAIDEIPNDSITHVVIPSGQSGVIYQWKQKAQGFVRAEACYGRVINIYSKPTSDINPATDPVYANFTDEIPILLLVFTPNWYYGFYSVDADDKGPEGINGAVDFVVSTDEAKMESMVPAIPSKIVEMKISMNSGTATLTWASTGSDNTNIYRKDVNIGDYSPEKWFPPERYYMTGCSAKLWMTLDQDATGNVKIQRHDDQVTGIVQLTGINKDTISLVAVTSEKKDVNDPFTSAYDFVAIGAASNTIVSVVALVVLLVSILI